ncbi:aldo/keto reductase [Streptomyces globosus]|uniref:Aldo/keto reductase n=1 Tax=Streptomyces globosus TaxID=68209 RepID=A0A344TTZ1_9ACTN|nr:MULTISPECIES: aldo/keto reductase [Streptomyces]AXE22112.1 aldo/keto reductase [Streptomyces globosus]
MTQLRSLGSAGPEVSALGLGLMSMSDFYGPADRAEGVATAHAAIEAGITLLDTGDFYGSGHNELLVREVLQSHDREQLTLSVKFGVLRDPAGGILGVDNRPEAVKNSLAQTLQRLGTDYVDVYRPARLDPAVPIEETIGAIKEMVEAGYVRHIGLSEIGAETLRRASAVHPIADLQIEYSLLSRSIEDEILPTARELGTAVTAYGVLARGLLSGRWNHQRATAKDDGRSSFPRFSGENLDRNLQLVAALGKVAEAKGVTTSQLAIGWAMAQGADIVPVVGSRRRDQLAEALGALSLELTAEDVAEIERAVPAEEVAGTRFDAEGMAMLDSEKKSGASGQAG